MFNHGMILSKSPRLHTQLLLCNHQSTTYVPSDETDLHSLYH